MASKSSKTRSDTAVQGTNDSSIVSKCSTVKCGYFADPFLKHFVAKEMRRAPLINRGYYVRAKALEFTVKHFFELYGSQRSQIVSVGCGFDSGYFRLKDQGLLENTSYVEVDFLDVATRKKHLIEDRVVLKDMLDNYAANNAHKEIVIQTGNYKLVGVDLTKLELLEKTLRHVDVDFTVPTLFLSEVAITYMPHRSATRLLYWAAHTFENAAFMMYEQIVPYDAFGQFMQAHFNNLGSILKSINTYPTPSAQKQRCIEQGWVDAFSIDINTFYQHFLSKEEHRRVEQLEPFDEFEEFALKCCHYFICIATKGSCCKMVDNMRISAPVLEETKEAQNKPMETPIALSTLANFNLVDKTNPYANKNKDDTSNIGNVAGSIQVFGHAVCRLYGSTVVVTGGFGKVEKKHSRWRHVVVCDFESGTSEAVTPFLTSCDSKAANGKASDLCERMYHTATTLDKNCIVIVGGRKSPTKSCDTICLLQVEESRCSGSGDKSHWTCSIEELEISGIKTAPFWRHTATKVTLKDVDHILLYGGRNEKDFILDQCFLLNTKTWTRQQVKSTGTTPGARHSHSAVLHKDRVIISGGVDMHLRPVNSVHILDIHTWMWTQVEIPNLFPRFSHCSLIRSDDLILVGGVGEQSPPPGCAVINLTNNTCDEKPLPLYNQIGEHQDPVIMFHNNAAILRKQDCYCDEIIVLGGGGNCFSFGTHLNISPILIHL